MCHRSLQVSNSSVEWSTLTTLTFNPLGPAKLLYNIDLQDLDGGAFECLNV